MKKDLITISKHLSYVLRHKPESIDLNLSSDGWACVEDIIQKSSPRITFEQIEETAKTNDKKRFELSEDKTKIRAAQGHSIDVNLELKPKTPPRYLYHGTAKRFEQSIRANGLKPQSRQFVHLSSNEETAREVGSRHGSPVVLRVEALALHKPGTEFYQSSNGVWLALYVPPSAIL